MFDKIWKVLENAVDIFENFVKGVTGLIFVMFIFVLGIGIFLVIILIGVQIIKWAWEF